MIRPLWDHVLFAARQRPDAFAVIDPVGAVPYRTLVADVETLATRLIEDKLTRDDMVGLHLGFSYLHLLMILALDRLGIPSATFQSDGDDATLPEIAPQYGVTALVSSRPAPAPAPPYRWITMAERDRPRPGRADTARLAGLDNPPDGLIRVMWSSGTSGGMKGSVVTRRVQAHRVGNRRSTWTFGARPRYFPGMSFDRSVGYSMTMTVLAAGGTVVLPNPALDFVTLANTLAVTATCGAPTMLGHVLAHEREVGRRLETIAYFEVLGTHLPAALAQAVCQSLTPNLWTLYGATEAGRVAIAHAAVSIADPSAVGYVLPWVDLEVVDDDDRPLPVGQEGHLRIRSAEIARGYHNDEAATRRNFRDGWFYPGDIGVLTETRLLRVTGRVEDLIRHGGTTIAPLPIEDAMRGLPGVRDVAVFGLDNTDGSHAICAALVLDPGTDVDAIRAMAAPRLGDRLPTQIFLVPSLPRNAGGKVVRRTLVENALRVRGP